MSEGYRVELEVFEGPLDLLLHLVKKHELDIFDIPIRFVTEKYLEYLELMRSLNLDVAGEFLLMAATLLHIKSRELLPQADDGAGDTDPDEPGDPRAELIRRLLEYQKYKEAGLALSERPMEGRDTFARGAPVDDVQGGEPPLAEVPVFKLIEHLSRLLEKAKITSSYDVVVERISIAQRINELIDRFAMEDNFTFESCFRLGTDDDPVAVVELRNQIVVTFLAVLEMARLKILRVHQPTDGGPIYLTRKTADLEKARHAFSEADSYQ